MGDEWPKVIRVVPPPETVVCVMMTEDMARRFEQACLGNYTHGFTRLTGPLLFSEDDLPTYIIGVGDEQEDSAVERATKAFEELAGDEQED